MPRLLVALAVAAATAFFALPLALSAPVRARGQPCLTQGYAYSGYASRSGDRVAATVTAVARPRVRSGHAGAWVGVGDRRAWLQVGIAAFPDNRPHVYYELRQAGSKPRYVELARVGVREPRRFAVVSAGAGRWQAFVDGRAVGGPVFLPGAPPLVATGESWTPAHSACNAFRFRFERVSLPGAPEAFAARA